MPKNRSVSSLAPSYGPTNVEVRAHAEFLNDHAIPKNVAMEYFDWVRIQAAKALCKTREEQAALLGLGVRRIQELDSEEQKAMVIGRFNSYLEGRFGSQLLAFCAGKGKTLPQIAAHFQRDEDQAKGLLTPFIARGEIGISVSEEGMERYYSLTNCSQITVSSPQDRKERAKDAMPLARGLQRIYCFDFNASEAGFDLIFKSFNPGKPWRQNSAMMLNDLDKGSIDRADGVDPGQTFGILFCCSRQTNGTSTQHVDDCLISWDSPLHCAYPHGIFADEQAQKAYLKDVEPVVLSEVKTLIAHAENEPGVKSPCRLTFGRGMYLTVGNQVS